PVDVPSLNFQKMPDHAGTSLMTATMSVFAGRSTDNNCRWASGPESGSGTVIVDDSNDPSDRERFPVAPGRYASLAPVTRSQAYISIVGRGVACDSGTGVFSIGGGWLPPLPSFRMTYSYEFHSSSPDQPVSRIERKL